MRVAFARVAREIAIVDETLLLFVNGLRTPWLDGALGFLSSFGVYAFPLFMLFALSQGWRTQLRAVLDGWLAWFVAAMSAEEIVKPLVARPRPTADEGVRALLHVLGRVPSPSSLSFPSGTAAAAFAGAVWITLRWGPRPGVPALVLATIISLSRVYVGVHWPSDVLAGAALGGLVAYGLERLVARLPLRG